MNMFKSTAAKTPTEYIDMILDEKRHTDFQKIFDVIQETLPDELPFMMGGMIGFVPYHYKYASGREGDWALICLANQKNYISIYACAAHDGKYVAEGYKEQLPKVSIGKSCIRIKKIEDIDLQVLKKIIKESLEVSKTHGFAI